MKPIKSNVVPLYAFLSMKIVQSREFSSVKEEWEIKLMTNGISRLFDSLEIEILQNHYYISMPSLFVLHLMQNY